MSTGWAEFEADLTIVKTENDFLSAVAPWSFNLNDIQKPESLTRLD
jgi:hypothetical protein